MSVVILGFSGGLDTTFSVLKLKEAGHDVVAVTVDIGQQMCADQIRARAVEAGCADFVLVDGVADFAEFLRRTGDFRLTRSTRTRIRWRRRSAGRTSPIALPTWLARTARRC